mgnify:CR=1 FL=1
MQHEFKPWGGTREMPKRTSNYVIFDPERIDILRKYGIPVTAGGMGALAAQDQYQE